MWALYSVSFNPSCRLSMFAFISSKSICIPPEFIIFFKSLILDLFDIMLLFVSDIAVFISDILVAHFVSNVFNSVIRSDTVLIFDEILFNSSSSIFIGWWQ